MEDTNLVNLENNCLENTQIMNGKNSKNNCIVRHIGKLKELWWQCIAFLSRKCQLSR